MSEGRRSLRFRRAVLLRILDQLRAQGVGRVWVKGDSAGPAAAWLALRTECDVAPWSDSVDQGRQLSKTPSSRTLIVLRADWVPGTEGLEGLLHQLRQEPARRRGLRTAMTTEGHSVLARVVPAGMALGEDVPTADEPSFPDGGSWQEWDLGEHFDLREPAGCRAWTRHIRQHLGRESDGPVARNVNRPLSTRLSLLLSRVGVGPDWMTGFLLLLGLGNAWVLWLRGAEGLLLAGTLVQVLSILDGCDGELARLRFQTTRSGAWFARLSGVLQTGFFLGVLLSMRYREMPGMVHLLGLLFFVLLYLILVYTLIRFYRDAPGRMPFSAIGSALEAMRSGQTHVWDRISVHLRGVAKPDVLALAVSLLTALQLLSVAFWMVLAATAAMSLTLVRARRFQVWKDLKSSSFFFYLLGLGLLALLFMTLPFPALKASFLSMGWRLGWVFLCPIPWTLVNTLALRTLLPVHVPFRSLLYNQLTGEAYNMILPLAGLGGEAYKVRHLVDWLPVSLAGRAILRDRLVHVLANFLYTGLAAGFTAVGVPLGLEIRLVLGGSAFLLVLLAALLFWLLATDRAGSALAWLLRKVRFLDEYRRDRMPFRVLLASVGYKVLGRALYLVEIAVIFMLLGIEVQAGRLIAVSAMIALSSTVFFVVPQGMGVNEAGISGAFALLGLVAHEGLVFGLIRRARIVIWALLGVLLHLAAMGLRRVVPRRRQDRSISLEDS